jgi:two-component system response regulator RegA
MTVAGVDGASTPVNSGRSVLIVDDDPIFRERLARSLGAAGFRVVAAVPGHALPAAAQLDAPEFAVVETRPFRGANDALATLVDCGLGTRVVALAHRGSIASAVGALRSGAHDYLSKPVEPDVVLDALWRLDGSRARAPVGVDATPSLARATWEHLQRILVESGGNISETARRLGIPRRSLQLKLKKDPPSS